MIIRRPPDIRSSEITPKNVYVNRRKFIKNAAFGMAGVATVPAVLNTLESEEPQEIPARFRSMRSELNEPLNSYSDITTYNNFYEFGTQKDDPHRNSGDFRPAPWTVRIGGEVNKPGDYQLEDLLSPQRMEDRVYRLRCVEAWSMVVPWVGIPLKSLLERFQPQGGARYVRFETLYDPDQMPGQRSLFSSIDYPYVEGLRMDEAMNDLAFIAVGVYGKALPNQNGAPLRLVVPWKYGFKSIKSIVKIEFTDRQPRTTWEKTAPREYGFYANVNPEVDHPRWSQATERRLPGSLFSNNRIETLMFNGYAPQVAPLYLGMNLKKHY